jgi:uncharacterized protein YcnI
LHPGGKTTEICNEHLSSHQAIRSREEFTRFVEGTVKAVMDLENGRRGDASSSLQVFCRVDVGVVQPKPGAGFTYYVNELERSLTVGLFRQGIASNAFAMIHSAVQSIPRYIDNSRGH